MATETTTTPETEQKLRKQIEFYFGDANLPFDKFIKLQCAQNEGWFPLPTLLKFNKVRSFTDDLSSDEDKLKKIEEVLKGSMLVEVNESGDKIRRNPEIPLPEGNSEERSVYIKGFHKTESKLDQLIDHFSKYEGFEAVIMRYYKEKVLVSTPIGNGNGSNASEVKPIKEEKEEAKETPKEGEEAKKDANGTTAVKVETAPASEEAAAAPAPAPESKPAIKVIPTEDKIVWHKKFKGSIFVVFNTVENAEKLLNDKEFSYPGNQMPYIRMSQKQYKEKKKTEFEERQEMRKNKAEEGESKPKADGDKKDEPKDEKDALEAAKDVLVKLATIPEGFSRETLKEKWYAVCPEDKFFIAFVDFQRGDTSAVLRLEREGAAKEAIELLSGKLPLGENASTTVEGIHGEEEEKYNKKIAEERAKLKRKGGPGGRGRGRGRGHGGKRGRRY